MTETVAHASLAHRINHALRQHAAIAELDRGARIQFTAAGHTVTGTLENYGEVTRRFVERAAPSRWEIDGAGPDPLARGISHTAVIDIWMDVRGHRRGLAPPALRGHRPRGGPALRRAAHLHRVRRYRGPLHVLPDPQGPPRLTCRRTLARPRRVSTAGALPRQGGD